MQNTESVQTVVVADSHAIVREGISDRLNHRNNWDVVAQAEDGYTALKVCREHKPDLLFMDLEITRPSGREVLFKMRSSCPDTKIIVLSSEMDIPKAFYCLSNGAVSFLPKQASGFDFVNAATSALRDYSYVPVTFMTSFFETRSRLDRSGNIYGLSSREMEIVHSCLQGRSTRDIAETCQISVRTVETHKSNIYRKTSCNSIDELMDMFSENSIG